MSSPLGQAGSRYPESGMAGTLMAAGELFGEWHVLMSLKSAPIRCPVTLPHLVLGSWNPSSKGPPKEPHGSDFMAG